MSYELGSGGPIPGVDEVKSIHERPEDRALAALSPVELEVWTRFACAALRGLTRVEAQWAADAADEMLKQWRARGGGGRR